MKCTLGCATGTILFYNRSQVGSYRVIVSFETPLLEDFSLCILQQNNCFNCDAKIIELPKVRPLASWRGEPLSAKASRQILIGHLNIPEAIFFEAGCDVEGKSRGLPWSWKVVCGANPAYDAFPAQHQIFYPSNKSPSTLWYDPVFRVETVDDRSIWCKRHYRCTPRNDKDPQGQSNGLWTFNTLDNGIVSNEHWAIVDCADDLSWLVVHYTGAAARAGTSYVGGLLCSADGLWPATAREGPEFDRIERAFRFGMGLELWELYGHGPPLPSKELSGDAVGSLSVDAAVVDTAAASLFPEAEHSVNKSFMWPSSHSLWEAKNPPPLERIGDMTVQAWRARERAAAR
jgi:hypothetical protein